MFPQIKYRWFPFLAVVVVIALSAVSFIYAWTEPLLSPPDGNVAAPVNVSNNPQTFVDTKTLRVKTDGTGVLVIEGGLRSDTFRTLYQSTFATISGNVGIGTLAPDFKLKIFGAQSATHGIYIGTSGSDYHGKLWVNNNTF